MLAKIASDWNKPNGQFEIREDQIDAFMVELPVRRLWVIGPKSAERLAKLGVHVCGDLPGYSHFQLFEEFGKFGPELYDLCRGIDARPVEPDRIRKSLSSERTFSQDLTSPAQCEAKLPELLKTSWVTCNSRNMSIECGRFLSRFGSPISAGPRSNAR